MPILSSSVVVDAAQLDGRRHIIEHHTDHVGIVYPVFYLAEAGADATLPLAARAIQIVDGLREAEVNDNLGRILAGEPLSAITTIHVDGATLRQRLRQAFQAATGERACRLAVFLQALTDVQLRAIFGITQAQVTTLRTRLQARIDKLNALLAEVGE